MARRKKEYLSLGDNAEAPKPEQLDDETVLELSKDKPEFFGMLVDRYEASFIRVAQRIVRSPEEAEDVVQEALVKIYRFANHFDRKQARFKSWAYKIVVNVAITHYNKKKHDAMLIPEDYDPTVVEAHRNHQSEERNRGLESVIASALEELPEDLNSLLKSYYLEDKSYKAIATNEGLSIGALKMKLFRARKGLKKVLEDRKEA
ncbi:MAG: sigma-70 family RNA polymerase sigma factor [bacterium]|nr:sigma-70 family RNA polymerase sigma factor [bacterium]